MQQNRKSTKGCKALYVFTRVYVYECVCTRVFVYQCRDSEISLTHSQVRKWENERKSRQSFSQPYTYSSRMSTGEGVNMGRRGY